LAKLDVIRSGKADPFYWGAFVLMGDTSPIDFSEPPTASGWTWAVIVGFGSGLAAVLIYKRVSTHKTKKYGAWMRLKGTRMGDLEGL
jgi:hypothetical protein